MTIEQHVALTRLPDHRLNPQDFSIRAGLATSSANEGDVSVQALMFGLNAGLRSRLGTGVSTTLGPPVLVGDTPRTDAIGLVVESARPDFPVGSIVVGLLPWASAAIVSGDDLRILPKGADRLKHLTLLGHVGMTAYVGLVTVGGLRRGETVWISSAAGGVGTCAVQIAQRIGARVIASAGSQRRRQFLFENLGVESVIDRRRNLHSQLETCAPEGLDLYLDLVGGSHFRAALSMLREHGRIIVAGRSGGTSDAPVLNDSAELIRRRITISGMSVTDHPEARAGLEALVNTDESGPPMLPVATVHQGLDSLPAAFCALLSGGVLGRALVHVGQATSPGFSTTDPH